MTRSELDYIAEQVTIKLFEMLSSKPKEKKGKVSPFKDILYKNKLKRLAKK